MAWYYILLIVLASVLIFTFILLFIIYITNADLKLVEKIKEGHDMQFIGRVGQFCPIKPGCNGGVLYRVNEGKNYAAPGSTGYRWLESEMVSTLEKYDDIDHSFYHKLIDDAVDTISNYCDFEWFVSDDPYISKPNLADFMHIPEDAADEMPFA